MTEEGYRQKSIAAIFSTYGLPSRKPVPHHFEDQASWAWTEIYEAAIDNLLNAARTRLDWWAL